MSWVNNTSPDTRKEKPGILHLVIKPTNRDGQPGDFGSFFRTFTDYHSETNSNAEFSASLFTIVLHERNRNADFWPHIHIVFKYSRGNRCWQWINQFLKLRNNKYSWSRVVDINAVLHYLETGGGRTLLFSTPWAGYISGQPELPDAGTDGETALWGCQEECGLKRKRHASGSSESPSEAVGSITSGDRPSVGSTSRAKSKVYAARDRLQEILETLQPPSITEFKSALVVDPRYRSDTQMLYNKFFEKNFGIAHEIARLRHKHTPWEQSLRMINMQTLKLRIKNMLSPVMSVYWIKQWCTHNKIDISEFVKNCLNVIDCRVQKINSIQIQGPPNSFKTVIAQSIIHSCIYYFNNNQLNGRTSQFGLQEAVSARVAFLDEIAIDDQWKEKLLLFVGGFDCNTDKKFSTPANIPRTPVIMCYNKVWGSILGFPYF